MKYKLSDKIINCRKHKKLSQQRCSEVCQIDLNEYINWENASMVPSETDLIILASLFEVEIDSLTDDEINLEYNDVIDSELVIPFFNNSDLGTTVQMSYITEEIKEDFLQDDNEEIITTKFISTLKKYLTKKNIIISSIILAVLIMAVAIISNDNAIEPEKTNNIMIDTNRLASGDGFTLSINDDYTVTGHGDNQEKQIDVASWNNVVQVTAGSNFSIGLLKDGSVVAVGQNNYGQLNVVEEVNVISIDAGKNHGVVLTNDNKVKCYGDNSEGQCNVDDWSDVIAISANENVTAGLTSDNQLLITGKYDFNNDLKVSNIKDFEVAQDYLFVITNDNKVEYSNSSKYDFSEIDNITNIKDIAISNNHVMLLSTSGRVYAYGDDKNNQLEVFEFINILAISASDDFSAILTQELEVQGVGDNQFNQFIKIEQKEVAKLGSVNNIIIDIDKQVKITWDAVDNAGYYLVEITEIDYSVKVADTNLIVANSEFIDLNDYTVKVTAYSSSDDYTESESVQVVFTFLAPIIEETQPPIIEITPTETPIPTPEPTPTPTPSQTPIPSVVPTPSFTPIVTDEPTKKPE